MSEYGLGWKPPEVRDPRNWPMSRLVALIEAGEAVPVKWDLPIGALGQGSTGHCVGFTGAAYIACAQAAVPGGDATVSDALGHELYYACKDKEDIPGGHAQREEGTSIHTLMRVLKDRGVIGAYAFGNFTDKVMWESKYGPTCMGTLWYASMFTPQADGSVFLGGSVAGGHAYLGRGVNHMVGVYLSSLNRNSWTARWGTIPGMPGDFYVHNADGYRLLDQENGECGMAVKFVKPTPPPEPPPPPPTPPPTPAPSPPSLVRSLHLATAHFKGPDVKLLQQRLMAKGYRLPKYGDDGDFGRETEAAVLAFRKAAYPADPFAWTGTVDPTWDLLNS